MFVIPYGAPEGYEWFVTLVVLVCLYFVVRKGRIRMSDFARWAEAGCRALGFREGEFLDAYTRNQARAMQLAFNNDPLAKAIALLIEQSGGRWAGNTKPLYKALRSAAVKGGESELLDHEDWPSNDSWLGRDLRKSAAGE
jgi:hypothetical protein